MLLIGLVEIQDSLDNKDNSETFWLALVSLADAKLNQYFVFNSTLSRHFSGCSLLNDVYLKINLQGQLPVLHGQVTCSELFMC